MKVKVKHTALTGFLKPKESEENIYLNKLIKVFRINRKLQAAEFVSRYELNSAGTWTSRTRAENL